MGHYALFLGIAEQQENPGDSPRLPSYTLFHHIAALLISYIMSVMQEKNTA